MNKVFFSLGLVTSLLFSCTSSDPGYDAATLIKIRNETHKAAFSDNKLTHEANLISNLKNSTSSTVKSFLIHELKLIGGEASIQPLSPYLLDSELGGDASQALLAIHNSISDQQKSLAAEPGVATALAAALPKARGKNLLHIVKTLGSVRQFDYDTLVRLEKMTKSSDTILKLTAVRAVAEHGAENSAATMLAAIEGEQAYNRRKIIASNLLYATNIEASKGEAHTLKVMSELDKTREVNSYISCLSTLQQIKGDDFTDELITYLGDQNRRIAVAAVYLLAESHDPTLNSKLMQRLTANGPLFQAQALKVLALNKAPEIASLVTQALSSDNQYLRSTAVGLSSQANVADVVDTLVRLVGSGTEEDKKVAAVALNRIPAKDCADSLVSAFGPADNQGKISLLALMATKRSPAIINLVFDATLSKDSKVKKQAYKTLKDLVLFIHVPRIIALMSKTKKASDFKGLQAALVKASHHKKDQAATQLLEVIQEDSGNKANLAFIEALGRVGGQKAFDGLVKLYRTGSEKVKKEAIRSLAKWQSRDQYDELLNFAANTEDRNRTLLTRGFSARIVNDTVDLLKRLDRLVPKGPEKDNIRDLLKKLEPKEDKKPKTGTQNKQ